MKFTLGEAAKQTGLSKATLSRALKKGRISSEKQPDGSYQIDASELFRVYPRVEGRAQETGAGDGSSGHAQPSPETAETGGLKAEVHRLRELLEKADLERVRERDQLTEQIHDLRRRLDSESEERKAMTLRLLTYQRPPDPPGPPLGPAPTADQGAARATRRGWSLFRHRSG